MAEIDLIVSKEAVESIKAADVALVAFDANMQKSLAVLAQFTKELSKQGITVKDLVTIQKAQVSQTKVINDAQKEAAKLVRESEKAAKAQAAAVEKLAAKEKAHNDALKLTVKTMADAKLQNSALRKEIDKLNPAITAEKVKLDQLNATVNKNTTFLKENSDAARQQSMNVGNYGSALSGLKSTLMGVAGALGITTGAFALVKGVIDATDTASDKLNETIGGVRSGLHYFAVALSTLDFSNFLNNMNAAIDAGKEYVKALDEIGDRTRAQGIIDSQTAKKRAELDVASKNVNLSTKERKAALTELLAIEKTNADMRLDLAQSTVKAELDYASSQTGLSQKRIKELLIENETNKTAVKAAKNYLDAIQTITDAQAKKSSAGGFILGLFGDKNDLEKAQAVIKNTPENIKSTAKELFSLGKINEERYNSISEAIKNAGNEEASYYEENNKRLTRANKLLKEEGKEGTNSSVKIKAAVETQISEYDKLNNRITELNSAMIELRLANKPIPDSMVRELISSQTALEKVKKEVEAIAVGMVAIQSKGASIIPVNVAPGTLTKRASTGSGGAAANKGAGTFAPGELSNLAIESAQITSDATFQIISDSATAEFDLKMSLMEKEKDAKLANAKLTEKQRAQIEADFQKKAAKLKQEQFKKQKAADIVQAIINTALAVTKLLATPAAAIAAGLAGAAQVAVIAAQKVPQFDSGTDSTPSTFIAGERRPEWMIEPSGRVQLVTKPTMFKNMAGATVIGGEQTKQMIEQGITPEQMDIRPDIARMERNFIYAIRNKRELHISASGRKITEREGNYNKEYFNRKVTWVGRNN